MKLTNKQKLSIYKSWKLNEDFFDDLNSNDLNDTVDDSFGEPDYIYHIHFIIYINQFIKCIIPKSPFMNRLNDEYLYYFEEPKYKPIIESGFLSMKKILDCILQATPIVTDYSEPKFCTISDKFISIFPFMNNEPEYQLALVKDEEVSSNIYKEFFNSSISLEMTLNLSDKKNQKNIEKLLYSFYKLDLIYNKLIRKVNTKLIAIPPVLFGYFIQNPFVRTGLIELISPTDEKRRYSSYTTDILLKNHEEFKKLHTENETRFKQLPKR